MVLPADAYRLWLDLHARGFTLTARDGRLYVDPPDRLTRQDCTDCRRWRWHLLMFLGRHDGATVAAVGPPAQHVPDPPECPHCASADLERLGRGWWVCLCCSRSFHTPEVTL